MSEPVDYDGAWKEALELYLAPFLQLCFPEIYRQIDWRVPVEFLDQELQEVVRDSELGKQRVDKLVKVRRLDGDAEWVLLHVEVQAQADDALPQRLDQEDPSSEYSPQTQLPMTQKLTFSILASQHFSILG